MLGRAHRGHLLVLAASIVCFSLWAYEIGNLLSLVINGGHAQLILQGVLPVGAVEYSYSAQVPLYIKPVQLLIGFCLITAVGAQLKSRCLPLSKLAILVTVAVYAASLQ